MFTGIVGRSVGDDSSKPSLTRWSMDLTATVRKAIGRARAWSFLDAALVSRRALGKFSNLAMISWRISVGNST